MTRPRVVRGRDDGVSVPGARPDARSTVAGRSAAAEVRAVASGARTPGGLNRGDAPIWGGTPHGRAGRPPRQRRCGGVGGGGVMVDGGRSGGRVVEGVSVWKRGPPGSGHGRGRRGRGVIGGAPPLPAPPPRPACPHSPLPVSGRSSENLTLRPSPSPSISIATTKHGTRSGGTTTSAYPNPHLADAFSPTQRCRLHGSTYAGQSHGHLPVLLQVLTGDATRNNYIVSTVDRAVVRV